MTESSAAQPGPADGVGPVVEVGPVAHGGHCVARLDGQVVFVRHALPGERVRLRITESSKRFLRADAVEVLRASAARVTPPCRWAGRCGGCDFQHVTPDGQRELLRSVVAEQLGRLAGIAWDGQVEDVEPHLGWRTRMQYAVDADGRPGLREHRSHRIVPIDECRIAHPELPPVLERTWPAASSVEAIVSTGGEQLTIVEPAPAAGAAPPGRVTEEVHQHRFRVSGSGFWQVHPAAARTLVDAVLAAAEVKPGDVVADLYAGVGLFTSFLADAVAETGMVHSVEVDRDAARDARRNQHGRSQVRLVAEPVERAVGRLGAVDVVVLDPPRAGAKKALRGIVGLQPRRIVYVACDPAALARDVASLQSHGYRLTGLRAFALFPMTHHVECVALLTKTGSDLR